MNTHHNELQSSDTVFFKDETGSLAKRPTVSVGAEAMNVACLALQALDQPVMLASVEGRLVLANPSAQTMLRDGALLRLNEGHLRMPGGDPSDFSKALRDAVEGGETEIVLQTEANARFAIRVKCLSTAAHTRREVVLMLVIRCVLPCAESLMARYKLTRSEAALVQRIVDGDEIRDASQALRISFHTGRKYLQVIFAKVGVRRQVELVRRVLADVQDQYP